MTGSGLVVQRLKNWRW